MLKTQLSLDYSSNLNLKVLRIFDTSHYCSEEDIDNYLIEVLPANSRKWVSFNGKKDFSIALNSSNLRYHIISEVEGLIDLPDGIYEFKMSYKPNSLTMVHFYHMRTTKFSSQILSERSKLLKELCNISREERNKNLRTLRDIEDFVSAAKYTVEECHEKAKGMELYKWAVKLLEEYSNECKC